MSAFNLLLAGVGGQGIVFTSRLLMEEAVGRGEHARGTETHGMAQRGGSVIAHVRFGSCRSPLIRTGAAHMIVALDGTEAARALSFLRPGGLLLVNAAENAFPAGEGTEQVRRYLETRNTVLELFDALALAKELGAVRSANMVLCGYAAALEETPFTLHGLREALMSIAKPAMQSAMIAAIESGYNAR